MSVDVIIEADGWVGVELAAFAKRATDATLKMQNIDPATRDIALLGTDDARIAKLNRDFRGKDRPTNVLSWPATKRGDTKPGNAPTPPQGNAELGDLALAFETCAREADAARRPLEDHVLHLIVHGTLHLLGYDHQRDLDADLMEATEIAILVKLGVPNPYKGGDTAGAVDDGKD